jgi:hypothetical protein
LTTSCYPQRAKPLDSLAQVSNPAQIPNPGDRVALVVIDRVVLAVLLPAQVVDLGLHHRLLAPAVIDRLALVVIDRLALAVLLPVRVLGPVPDRVALLRLMMSPVVEHTPKTLRLAKL